MTKLLVTGGAGYVGSHVVKALGERGFELLIYDNLSTGDFRSVRYGAKIKGDLLDTQQLGEVMQAFRPHAVLHFAACSIVPESLQKPLLYYRNNVQGTLTLLHAMQKAGVQKILFSSSAAVYGNPTHPEPIAETAPLAPVHPYGRTKAMAEQMLQDLHHAGALEYLSLRYFNAAGADPEGEIGERRANATHLITRCVRAACGTIPALELYGTDYPTPDGTCLRDYIHVTDLATAHSLALDYLFSEPGRGEAFNCGYGRGYSVLDVIAATRRVTGIDFPVHHQGRRPGDPPVLLAASEKIRRTLNWTPLRDDLDSIIASAWEWEKKLG